MRYYLRVRRYRPRSGPRGKLDRRGPGRETAHVMQRDPKRLAAAVKAVRGSMGLSQKEFALKGGIGVASVQRAEAGDKVPWDSTLAGLDRAGGKPAGWFAGVLDGTVPLPHESGADTSASADPEPLSPDWWLTLRRALPPQMFAEVSELVHLGQKAAAEGNQSADRA